MEGDFKIMPTNIENQVVSMKFDNSNFEANTKTTLSTLDKLKEKIKFKNSKTGFEDLGKAADKTSSQLTAMDKTVNTLKASFSAIDVIAGTALVNITNSAIQAGKSLVNAFAIDPVRTGFTEYETQINATQTILANTAKEGTNITIVNKALDELNTYADKTIYNFTEMTRNIGTFTAAGVKLDTSVEAIKGIANLAAVSGSNAQQASNAMYQLSQALSSGRLTLMDWNSVVNAGMGGQIFQDALMETARVSGVAIDQMIKDQGSFRNTLSEEWLTSEILTKTLAKFTGDLSEEQLRQQGYTEEQTKEIISLGKMANAAATEVKTFTQLIDVLKEAVQSGWSQSFRLIVGDFEQAKKLFTSVSNTLSEFIGTTSDARNQLLSSGLGSGFEKFLSGGIHDKDSFISFLNLELSRNGIIVEDLEKEYGSLENAINKGKVPMDHIVMATNHLAYASKKLTEEQKEQAGYTQEQLDALIDFDLSLKNGTLSIEDFENSMSRISGRENIIKSLSNTFEALLLIINPIKESLSELIPDITGDDVYSLTEKLVEFTEKLKISEETSEKIKKTLGGLVSIIKFLRDITTGFVQTGLTILGNILGDVNIDILDMAAYVGQLLTAFTNWADANNVLDEMFNGILGLSESFTKVIPDVVGKFSELTIIEDIVTNIRKILDSESISIENIFGAIGTSISNVFKNIQNISANDLLLLIIESIKRAFEGLSSVISRVYGNIQNTLSGTIDFLLDHIALITTIGATIGAVKIASDISKISVSITKFVDALSSVSIAVAKTVTALSGYLNAKTFAIKSTAILKIAAAIAILAGSLFLLTKLDTTKLLTAIGILLGLTTVLTLLSIALTVTSSSFSINNPSATILSLATALLILVFASEKIASLEQDLLGVIKIIGILGTLSIILSNAVGLISKKSKDAIKGAPTILALSVSLFILAESLSRLSELPLGKAGTALVTMVALLAGMALISATSKKISLSTAVNLLAMAVSLRLFMNILEDLVALDLNFDTPDITAYGGLIVSLGILLVALKFAGENAAKAGLAALGIAGALLIMTQVIKILAATSSEDLTKGTLVVAGLMVLFGAIILASHFAGQYAIQAGLSLVSMAIAIGILAGIITLLSYLNPNSLVAPTLAIMGLIAAFSLIIKASGSAGKATPAILTISITIGILTAAMLLLSTLDNSGLERAIKAMASITLIFGAIIAISKFATGSIGTIITMTIAVTLLSGMLYLLTTLPYENALLAASSIAIVMGVFTLSLTIISKVSILAGTAYISLGVMLLVVGALSLILYQLVNNIDADKAMPVVLALSTILGAFVISLGVLATIGAFGPAALIGIGSLLVLIGSLAILMAAVAGLNTLFPDLRTFLSSSLPTLELIGQALGTFVGGIVDSFLTTATQSLPEIGTNLSNFATNASPFFEIVKGIDSKAIDGVTNLIGTLALITANDFLNGIASFFGVDVDYVQLGEDLESLGIGAGKFISALDGVSVKQITAAAAIMTAITDVAKSMPNDGGLAGVIFGENNAGDFGEALPALGDGILSFGVSVSGIDGYKTAVFTSMECLQKICDVAYNIPNSGGFLGLLLGNNTIDTFGEALPALGDGILSFGSNVDGMSSYETSVFSAINCLEKICTGASAIPNSGGFLGLLLGNNTIDTFGEALPALGAGILSFGISVSGISLMEANIITAIGLLSKMCTTVGALPVKNIHPQINKLEPPLKPEFGAQLLEFAKSVNGIGAYDSSISSAILALTRIDSAFVLLNDIGTVDITSYGSQLYDLGYGLKEFGKSVAGITLYETNMISALNILDSIFNLLSSKPDSYGGSAMTDIGEDIKQFGLKLSTAIEEFPKSSELLQFEANIAQLEKVSGKLLAFHGGAQPLIDNKTMQYFSTQLGYISTIDYKEINNVTDALDYFIQTVFKMDSTVSKNISDTRLELTSLGAYTIDGIIEGLGGKRAELKSSLVGISDLILDTLREELGIHSPAEALKKIADFCIQGLEKGMSYASGLKSKVLNVAGGILGDFGINLSPDLGIGVGSDFMSGIATGIASDTSAGQAAQDQVSFINSFYDALRKPAELDISTEDIEYTAWETRYGADVSDREKDIKKMESLNRSLALEAEKLEYTKQEYAAFVDTFGVDSEEAQGVYNKLLEQYTTATSVSNEIKELDKQINESFETSKKEYEEANQARIEYFEERIDRWLEMGLSAEALMKLATEETGFDKVKAPVEDPTQQKTIDDILKNVTNFQTILDSVYSGISSGFVNSSISAGATTAKSYAEGIKQGTPEVKTSTTDMTQIVSTEITKSESNFITSGSSIPESIATGMTDNTEVVIISITTIMDKCLEVLNNKINNFKQAGSSFMGSMVTGLNETVTVANSISNYDNVDSTTLTNSIQKIINSSLSGVNTEFVIRPVLDISNVEKGVIRMTSLFKSLQSVQFSASVNNPYSQSVDSSVPNSGGNVYNITQNNTSPKALSAVEIYRQTNNLFSTIKRA